MFIDVHCHVDMLEDAGSAILRARRENVKIIVVNGVNPRHNRAILGLAAHYPEIKPALGMYPIDALALSDNEITEEIEFFRRRAKDFVAIGEIGLDRKEEPTDFERQKKKLLNCLKVLVLKK